ncbi:MAG: EFR1 family ferrodoxin, partial [Clostridia bacterium]|nr:EFR1 family ferrodoxin [Clostridia bacterium]
NAPTPIYDFLKRFPVCQGFEGEVFLLRTSGEPLSLNHASGIVPARILKRRGYLVVGEFAHVMPYNIIFRHPDGMVSRMDAASDLKIVKDCDDLEAGSGWRAKVNPFKRAFTFMVRIEHPAMPAIGRTFRVKKKLCVSCSKCAKVCPRGNITMKDGKPKFGGHCVGCMACAFLCPKDAVRTSILNSWRVNGKYSFEGEPVEDKKVIRYCRRSYLRYFHEAEALAALSEEDTNEE